MMDMDLRWLEQKGISLKDGMSFTGSNDKYISALQRYFNGYQTNKKAVEDYLNSMDVENFAIKVHSLKSNSRMIGANDLGAAFEELELAAKNNDTDLINKKTPDVLKMYADIIEIIRPIGEAQAVKVIGELNADEAKETADKLLEALDDFDDEASAELVEKLKGYPFRITQKEKLKEAAANIGEFMYDEAAELIKEIISAIE